MAKPIISQAGRNDHRHSIVKTSDIRCCFTGQNRKDGKGCSIFKPVQSGKIDRFSFMGLKAILLIWFFAMIPLKICRCRNQAASHLHTLAKCRLLRSRFTSCVDEKPILNTEPPLHNERGPLQTTIQSNDRSLIAGFNFAKGKTQIASRSLCSSLFPI